MRRALLALAAIALASTIGAHAAHAQSGPTAEQEQYERERHLRVLHNLLCPPARTSSTYVKHEQPGPYVLRIDGRDLPACRATRYLEPPDGATYTSRSCGNAPWAGESSCVTTERPVPSIADRVETEIGRLEYRVRPVIFAGDGESRRPYWLSVGELQPFLLHDGDVPWQQEPPHESVAFLFEPHALRLTTPELRAIIVFTSQVDRLTDTPSTLVTVHPF